MAKYQLDTAGWLWDAWTDTVPRSRTLNDRLVELIAQDLLEQTDDELPPEVQRRAKEVIEDGPEPTL